MTFRSLLLDRIGDGPGQYPSIPKMAEALGIGQSRFYLWTSGKNQPRGGLKAMLAIAAQLGYTQEEATKKILEEDPESGVVERIVKVPVEQPTEQVLAERAHMPPGVIEQFTGLDQDDPEVWAEAWELAFPVLRQVLEMKTRRPPAG